MCYNVSLNGDIMSKKRINIYTNMDKIINNDNFDAIVSNNVIKYIDLVNNKFVVDCNNDILIKENNDTLVKIDFSKNIISILLKEYNKEFYKEIDTLLINRDNNIYYVKYKLIDENVINEYRIEFL